MIIQIRGTSGSGKSTIVRRVMEMFPEREPQFIDGRKQPILYVLRNGFSPPLVVLGHYESPCGGCDTLESFDEVFSLAEAAHEGGYNVLMEGVLMYCEIPRTLGFHLLGYPQHIIALDTDLQTCVAGVNARRLERGNLEPVNPANTATKHRGTVTTVKALAALGVPVVWESRDAAFNSISTQLL